MPNHFQLLQKGNSKIRNGLKNLEKAACIKKKGDFEQYTRFKYQIHIYIQREGGGEREITTSQINSPTMNIT